MFDPGLFFDQAERLAQSGASEEDYRTAVSRAYYACHLTARNRLFGVDARDWDASGKRPSHVTVIGAVREALAIREVLEGMGRLKVARERADYVCDPLHPEVRELFDDFAVDGWAGMAHEAITLARDLLPHLRGLERVA